MQWYRFVQIKNIKITSLNKHFQMGTEVDQHNCTLERSKRSEVYNVLRQIIPHINDSLSEKPVTCIRSAVCFAELVSMTTSTSITELEQLGTG